MTQHSLPGNTKIRHFCTYPGKGGAGIAAMRLVNGLCRAGTDALLTGVSASVDQEHTSGIQYSKKITDRLWRRYRKFEVEPIQSTIRNPQFSEYFFTTDVSPHGRAMGQEMSSADLVHLHWVSDFIDFPTTLAMVPNHVPVVWTFHDMGVFTGGCSHAFECRGFEGRCGICPQQPQICRETRKSYQRREKALRFVRDRMAIVSPSEWLATETHHSSLMKDIPCHVIKNGLDLSVFHPGLRPFARQSLGFGPEDVVLLFAAASLKTPVKGMPILCRALEQLRGDVSLKICFVGATIPEGFPSDWNWLGQTRSDDEIASFYAAADMLIVPSLAENLPNVICEALACGVPVIGSEIGGIPELVVNGETGYLFECRNSDALGARILQLAKEVRVSRQAWSFRCRSYAEKFLGIDDCIQSHLRLYDQLLQPS